MCLPASLFTYMVLVSTRRAEYIVKHTFSISTNGCLPQCAQALKTKLFANRGMICVSGPLVELRQDCQNQTRARVSSTNVVLLLSDASALNTLFDIYGWPKKSVSLIFVKVSSIWNIIFVFLYDKPISTDFFRLEINSRKPVFNPFPFSTISFRAYQHKHCFV